MVKSPIQMCPAMMDGSTFFQAERGGGGFELTGSEAVRSTYEPPRIVSELTVANGRRALPARTLKEFKLPVHPAAGTQPLTLEEFETLPESDWKLIKLLADLSATAEPSPSEQLDRDHIILAHARQLLFNCIALKQEILSDPDLPQGVGSYVESNLLDESTISLLVKLDTDKVRRLYLLLARDYRKALTLKTYLAMGNPDDRARYIFPSLAVGSDWKHYHSTGGLADIRLIGSYGAKSAVREALSHLDDILRRADAQDAGRLLTGFVDQIDAVPFHGYEIGGEALGGAYRCFILAVDTIGCSAGLLTVSIHEAEHNRFNNVVWVLVQSGLISIKKKLDLDYISEKDVGGPDEVSLLANLFDMEPIRRGSELVMDTNWLQWDYSLFSEIFARYREIDAIPLYGPAFEQLNSEYIADQLSALAVLTRAVEVSFDVDPMIQAVINRYKAYERVYKERRMQRSRDIAAKLMGDMD